jgi:hypothetical protein
MRGLKQGEVIQVGAGLCRRRREEPLVGVWIKLPSQQAVLPGA